MLKVFRFESILRAEYLMQNSRLVALPIRHVCGEAHHILPPSRAAFRWLPLLHTNMDWDKFYIKIYHFDETHDFRVLNVFHQRQP